MIEQTTLAALREELAALEHEQWAAWAMTLLATEPISAERRARWQPLINAGYDDLSEEMKDHDRKWADRSLAAMHAAGVRVGDAGLEPAGFSIAMSGEPYWSEGPATGDAGLDVERLAATVDAAIIGMVRTSWPMDRSAEEKGWNEALHAARKKARASSRRESPLASPSPPPSTWRHWNGCCGSGESSIRATVSASPLPTPRRSSVTDTDRLAARCAATKPGAINPDYVKHCPRRATHGEWCRQHAESIGGWRLQPPGHYVGDGCSAHVMERHAQPAPALDVERLREALHDAMENDAEQVGWAESKTTDLPMEEVHRVIDAVCSAIAREYAALNRETPA